MRARSLLALFIALAITVGVIPAVAPPARASAAGLPPAATLPNGASAMIDSSSSSWQYVGAWKQPTVSGSHGATQAQATAAGSRATLQFFGSSITLHGLRSMTGGDWRITLDCQQIVTGNSFSVFTESAGVLAEFSNLTNTMHTVVVEALGTSTWPSGGTTVSIDTASVVTPQLVGNAMTPFIGSAQNTDGTPFELRRPGCGAASSLLEVIKSRTSGGQFAVPGTDGYLGRVNAHALTEAQAPSALGPLTVTGAPREGASIPVLEGQTVHVGMRLPDRPRTLMLSLAADEAVGSPLQVAVVNADGDFLEIVAVDEQGTATKPAERMMRLETRSQVTLFADLRDASGAGGHESVSLVVIPVDAEPAELTVLAGRTSDVAFERAANQNSRGFASADAQQLTAPQSAFLAGPVLLSRVVADANRSAWTGDQNTVGETTAVGVGIGSAAANKPTTVNGTRLPSDTLSVQLPKAASGTTSVYLKFDTAQRCRSFTASVGIDDATPSRAAASVTVGVYGDGEAVPLAHNGSWAHSLDTGAGTLKSDSVSNGFARQELATQLRDLKLGWVGNLKTDDDTKKALTSLANAEFAARSAMFDDHSASTMTYPLANPVALGAGAQSAAPALFLRPEWVRTLVPGTHIFTSGQPEVATSIQNPLDMMAISADLVNPRVKHALVASATRVLAGSDQVEAALSRIVHVVISGTPGAIVDIAGAGMDCVSAQPAADGTPAPRAMPLYSQLGVPPLFLPAPVDASGTVLRALAANPLWWDLACPAGPSTDGRSYTAKRERITTSAPWWGGDGGGTYRVVDVATASKPACGFPADQLSDNFGAYEFSHALDELRVPEHDLRVVGTHVTDALAQRLDSIRTDWSMSQAGWFDRALHWMSTLQKEVEDDPITNIIWVLTLAIDLPGALIFNPYVIHSAPLPLQVILGIAMMSASLAESGVVRAIPAASGLAHSAGRALEASNELLLLSAEQAARTNMLVLTTSDGRRFGVSLVAGTSEATADVRVVTSTTPTIGTDSANATMPITGERAPWTTDIDRVTSEETHVRCTRVSTGPECVASHDEFSGDAPAEAPGAAPEPAGPAVWTAPHAVPGSGGIWHVGGGQLDQYVATSFWTRYQWAARSYVKTMAVTQEQIDNAIKATSLMQQGMPGSDLPNLVYVGAQGMSGQVGPARVVYSADSAPLYHLTNRTPEEVFAFGLGPTSERVSEIKSDLPLFQADFDLGLHANGVGSGVFVSTTRDPDLLGANAMNLAHEAAHWMVKIVRPYGSGGGYEVTASVLQAARQDKTPIPDVLSRSRVTSKAEVALLSVNPQSIQEMYFVQYNPAVGRFVKTDVVKNPNFDVQLAYGPNATEAPAPTAQEMFAANVWGSRLPNPPGVYLHKWAKFDYPTGAGARHAVLPSKPAPIPPPPPRILAKNYSTFAPKTVWSPEGRAWQVYDSVAFQLSDSVLAEQYVKGYFPAAHKTIPVWIPKGADAPGFVPAELTPTTPTTRAEWPTGPITITGGAGALVDTGVTYRGMSGVHHVGSGGDASKAEAEAAWRLEAGADGTFRILNEATGAALHATGNDYDNAPGLGAVNVVASPAAWNTAEQRWNLTQNADGSASLTNVAHPGFGLEQDSRSCGECGQGLLAVSASPGDSTQSSRQWTFARAAAWPTTAFSLTSSAGSLADSGVTYRGIGGAHYVGTVAAASDDSAQWTLDARPDGTFRILNVATGAALHATGNDYDAAPAAGRNLVATPASWNTVEQRWTLNRQADGTVTITSVAFPTLAVDIDSAACTSCGTGFGGVLAGTTTDEHPARGWSMTPG